jgi:catechol 2,3-dioxygenase-like lactoylglutathione lyase family enzyme
MTVRLDHVQVAIPPGGEEAARGFYVDLLGLTEIAKPDSMRSAGGVWFAEGLHLGVEEPFAPARKAHPGLGVDDLDAVAERLAADGHDVAWDERWEGVRRLHTHDPFGNRVELLESSAAPGASS